MKRTALVIAHEPARRFLLTSTLRSTSWWVGEASRLGQATNLLGTIRVDLLLVDLATYGSQELRLLCDRARQVKAPTKTRIVILVDWRNARRIREEFGDSVDFVLQKPFTRQVLVEWISAVFSPRRSLPARLTKVPTLMSPRDARDPGHGDGDVAMTRGYVENDRALGQGRGRMGVRRKWWMRGHQSAPHR